MTSNALQLDRKADDDVTVEDEQLGGETAATATPSESAEEMVNADPIRLHLSDEDIQRIVEAGQFSNFIIQHDLVWGWVEDPGDRWYVEGEAKPRGSVVLPPKHSRHFYDALLSHPKTKERILSASSVDFTRVPPDSLTETEFWSLSDTGRFRQFVDFHGITKQFTQAQSVELIEPATIEEFHRLRARALDATPEEVTGRFKEILLGYLEPTVAFFDYHLLRGTPLGSRGVPAPQGLLDLFALYLQTRSQESIAEALAVYFGIRDDEAVAAAYPVVAAFFGFLENARAVGIRSRAAEDTPSTIESILDTFPDNGRNVSSPRPFDQIDEHWGAAASLLLNDLDMAPLFLFGLPSQLPPCEACHGEKLFNQGALDLGLIERAAKRRADTAGLAEKVRQIDSLDDVYGVVHFFKASKVDRDYLYDQVIGVSESLVDAAANAPLPVPPNREVCDECHDAPFQLMPDRPADVNATEAEWLLAWKLAEARRSQDAWDQTVSVLIIGGSIVAALAAGPLTGGVTWAALPAAMAAAGGAAAAASLYEYHEARVTEQIASGANAAAELFPEFGLGSEQFLIWAEQNLEHTRSAAIGNVLVAIATAPIGGVEGAAIKKILAAMAMGGLDGFCSWLVDKRLNDADFLLETHELAGGARETAPTPTTTLVMSISASALIGGAFEGVAIGAGRIFFSVELGSGRTRVTGRHGTDLTVQIEAADQRLRQGDSAFPESVEGADIESRGNVSSPANARTTVIQLQKLTSRLIEFKNSLTAYGRMGTELEILEKELAGLTESAAVSGNQEAIMPAYKDIDSRLGDLITLDRTHQKAANLERDEVAAELRWADRNGWHPGDKPGVVREAELPNTHTWRDKDTGQLCRTSTEWCPTTREITRRGVTQQSEFNLGEGDLSPQQPIGGSTEMPMRDLATNLFNCQVCTANGLIFVLTGQLRTATSKQPILTENMPLMAGSVLSDLNAYMEANNLPQRYRVQVVKDKRAMPEGVYIGFAGVNLMAGTASHVVLIHVDSANKRSMIDLQMDPLPRDKEGESRTRAIDTKFETPGERASYLKKFFGRAPDHDDGWAAYQVVEIQEERNQFEQSIQQLRARISDPANPIVAGDVAAKDHKAVIDHLIQLGNIDALTPDEKTYLKDVLTAAEPKLDRIVDGMARLQETLPQMDVLLETIAVTRTPDQWAEHFGNLSQKGPAPIVKVYASLFAKYGGASPDVKTFREVLADF